MEIIADLFMLGVVLILPLFGVIVSVHILWNYLKYLVKK